MPHNMERVKSLDVKRLFLNEVEVTVPASQLNLLTSVTAPQLSLLAATSLVKVAKVALAAVDTGGGVFSWANPESGAIAILRVLLDVTTKSTSACTLAVGTTTVSGTTSASNILNGLDVGTAAGLFDNFAATVGAGGAAVRLASGKWVTGSKASGASAGIVGSAYIYYLTL